MAAAKTPSVNGTGKGHPRSEKSAKKAKAKPKPERGSRSRGESATVTKPRTKAAARNRQNGRKRSGGPRTEAGKARTRYNALKHGMTATSLILPGEDSAEFDARLARLHHQIQPRNDIEAAMVDHLAHILWISERIHRSATARAAYRIHHQPLEEARAEEQSVNKLGQYLLKDLFRPAGILQCEREGGARHPCLLVLKLEATLTGCDWLLARLDRIRERAQVPGNWLEDDGFELVRLLGKYRGELTRDDLVAMVLLDSACLAEETVSRKLAHESAKARAQAAFEANAHAEIAASKAAEVIPARTASEGSAAYIVGAIPAGCASKVSDELDEDDDEATPDEELQFFDGPACQEYREVARRFGRPEYVVNDALKLIANRPNYGVPMLRLEKLNPKNIEHARDRITRVIDEYSQRVREIRSVHARIKAADDARAAERLAFDPSPEADKERRYIQSQERLLNQNIATIIKARKASNDGTFAEIEIESGVALDFDSNTRGDVAAISPSLAFRSALNSVEGSRMGSAPAEASAADHKTPDDAAPEMSQTLAGEVTCAEPKFLRNELHADASARSSEPVLPAVEAGAHSAPSSAPAGRPVPRPESSAEIAANGRSASRPPRAATTARPQSEGELQPEPRATEPRRQPSSALPQEIQDRIQEIQAALWRHKTRPYLRPEYVERYREYLREHLG
jgi:hypothetical protein